MKQFVSLRHLFLKVWRPSEGRPRYRRLDPRRKKIAWIYHQPQECVHLNVHVLLLMYKSLQNISASAYLSSVTLVTCFWIEKKCCCQRFIDLLHSKADWTRLNQKHNDKNKTQWKMLHLWNNLGKCDFFLSNNAQFHFNIVTFLLYNAKLNC